MELRDHGLAESFPASQVRLRASTAECTPTRTPTLEEVWERPDGPTATVDSEQDTNRHSHDWDQVTKLTAQVTIKNLQNMHAKSPPPTGARGRIEEEYQDWARLQGRGAHTGGPKDRTYTDSGRQLQDPLAPQLSSS